MGETMKNIPEFLKMKPIWSEYKNDEYYKEHKARFVTRFGNISPLKVRYDNIRNYYFIEKKPKMY